MEIHLYITESKIGILCRKKCIFCGKLKLGFWTSDGWKWTYPEKDEEESV